MWLQLKYFFAIRGILTWLLVHCLLLIALIFTVPSENSSREGGISVAMASGTFATTLAGLVSTVIIYVEGDSNVNIFFIMKSTVNSLCRAWRHFSYPCPMSSTQGSDLIWVLIFWTFKTPIEQDTVCNYYHYYTFNTSINLMVQSSIAVNPPTRPPKMFSF